MNKYLNRLAWIGAFLSVMVWVLILAAICIVSVYMGVTHDWFWFVGVVAVLGFLPLPDFVNLIADKLD